jgi:hypothetical protein
MGEDVPAQEFTRADRTRHREKVRRNLDVFARMLREAHFDTDDPLTGLEVELNLVDDAGDPALRNAEALEAIADAAFQTELGQFNIEINVPPARLREGGLTTFEDGLRRSLNDAEARSSTVGAHLVMIGILPTLAEGHLRPDSISANPRYRLLSEQILNARGEVADVLFEQVEDRGDPALAEPHPRPHALRLQFFAARVGGLLEERNARLSPELLAQQIWRVGRHGELHSRDRLRGVPVRRERIGGCLHVQLRAGAGGFRQDRVGGGDQAFGTTD